eukprot:5104227-Alexandrium_andersonii.AAC.1
MRSGCPPCARHAGSRASSAHRRVHVRRLSCPHLRGPLSCARALLQHPRGLPIGTARGWAT